MENRKIYFSPFDKRIASHIYSDRETTCRLGKRQISVGPDGSYYPCVQFVGRSEYSIGDIHNGLDREKQHEIYCLNEQDKPECSGCALERRCHNKCGCLNMQTTGDISRIAPVLCEHERMLMPIADKLAEKLYKKRSAMFMQRHYNSLYPVLSYLEDLSS